MTPARGPTFTSESWFLAWLRTAAVGTSLLVAIFAGYEVAERSWLLGRVPLRWLFAFHILRGAGAAVLLGSWAVYNIWRTRRRYDSAFARAYADLEAAMCERRQELERARAFTERVFHALRDPIVVIDRSGRVVKANRVALENSHGCDPIGQVCRMLDGACQSDDCVARAAIESGRPVLGRVRSDPHSGRIYSLDAYPVPDPEGGPDLAIEAARDITQAKQLEAQLRYQEKLTALGVLAAGIAHDIGNPLASMSSELELLESEGDLSRVRVSVSELRGQVARIGRTLRDMTDFARRRGEDAGAARVDVAVDDALRMVRHDPRARRVRFRVEVEPGLPELPVIEDHLVMVLVNLFINAFDAMPGEGSISIRAARRGSDGVRLSVSDDGSGMAEEVRQRALDPLFTTKPGGTGLGLSVSAGLVRGAGGEIGIESAPGRGTTVQIELPSAAAQEAARA